MKVESTDTIMHGDMTIGEKYEPAMHMTDPKEAAEYFEFLVKKNMQSFGTSYNEAVQYEIGNLGYYSGYFDTETRQRVNRLFGAVHPVLGNS